MATARPANLIPIIAATPEGTQKQADTIPGKSFDGKKKDDEKTKAETAATQKQK